MSKLQWDAKYTGYRVPINYEFYIFEDSNFENSQGSIEQSVKKYLRVNKLPIRYRDSNGNIQISNYGDSNYNTITLKDFNLLTLNAPIDSNLYENKLTLLPTQSNEFRGFPKLILNPVSIKFSKSGDQTKLQLMLNTTLDYIYPYSLKIRISYYIGNSIQSYDQWKNNATTVNIDNYPISLLNKTINELLIDVSPSQTSGYFNYRVDLFEDYSNDGIINNSGFPIDGGEYYTVSAAVDYSQLIQDIKIINSYDYTSAINGEYLIPYGNIDKNSHAGLKKSDSVWWRYSGYYPNVSATSILGNGSTDVYVAANWKEFPYFQGRSVYPQTVYHFNNGNLIKQAIGRQPDEYFQP